MQTFGAFGPEVKVLGPLTLRGGFEGDVEEELGVV
jgi:hypothetical protein